MESPPAPREPNAIGPECGAMQTFERVTRDARSGFAAMLADNSRNADGVRFHSVGVFRERRTDKERRTDPSANVDIGPVGLDEPLKRCTRVRFPRASGVVTPEGIIRSRRYHPAVHRKSVHVEACCPRARPITLAALSCMLPQPETIAPVVRAVTDVDAASLAPPRRRCRLDAELPQGPPDAASVRVETERALHGRRLRFYFVASLGCKSRWAHRF